MKKDHDAKGKPGRLRGLVTKKYTVLLEPEVGEWGKQQPGGLSDLVRRLMRQAKGDKR